MCAGRPTLPPTPKLFSWNHPDGACETCGGLGRGITLPGDLVIPDPSLSLNKGAVKPWRLDPER